MPCQARSRHLLLAALPVVMLMTALLATALGAASAAGLTSRGWITEIAADGTQEPPPPPTPPTPPPIPTPSPTLIATRPTSPQGLSLWSDGDSVSYFMTTNLFTLLAARGATPVRAADYKISSRLTHAAGSSAVLNVPFTDWFSYMAAEIARYNPDIVVLMVGTNDIGFASADAFGQDAGRMMDLMHREGRVVAWVGLPAFGRADLARGAPAFDAAARAAAASRPWVVFVSVANIAPDGDDGVHFGPAHARLLAQAVISALFPD